MITPDSQVLKVTVDGQSLEGQSWKPVRSVPILQEAVALWYYQSLTSLSSSDSSQPPVQGPVDCRTLVNNLCQQQQEPLTVDDYSSTTRVYSETTQAWKLLSEVPHLQTVLRALQPSQSNISTTSNPEEMAFPDEHAKTTDTATTSNKSHINDELEAFLADTEQQLGKQNIHLQDGTNNNNNNNNDDEEEAYESDGGTRYLRDHASGKWVHEDLVQLARQQQETNNHDALPNKPPTKTKLPTPSTTQQSSSKKRKRGQFAARNAKHWIYVTGLPLDTNTEELHKVFSKAGILDLDPTTLQPKIKLYRHKLDNTLKGDASLCYARPESVELAMTLLDGTPLRYENDDTNTIMSVQRAKFEQHGAQYDTAKTKRISQTQRKVAQLAAYQARDWDEGDTDRLAGGRKGLRIIVLKHVWKRIVNDDDDDNNKDSTADKNNNDTNPEEAAFQAKLGRACEAHGQVEKMTLFANHPDGVVIVKYATPKAASDAIQAFHGQTEWTGRPVQAIFWDGETDYSTLKDEAKEQEEMEARHEEFGQWLEEQEDLPEELRLKTAND